MCKNSFQNWKITDPGGLHSSERRGDTKGQSQASQGPVGSAEDESQPAEDESQPAGDESQPVLRPGWWCNNVCNKLSPLRCVLRRLANPSGQGRKLVERVSVPCVRPRTSKGITDLLASGIGCVPLAASCCSDLQHIIVRTVISHACPDKRTVLCSCGNARRAHGEGARVHASSFRFVASPPGDE